MKFFDEAIINVYAGNGGNGCSSFYKTKKIFNGSPDGGNGGNGGNIFIVSNNNIDNLLRFTYNVKFKAKDGENGKKNNCYGKNGNNVFIKVPVNTKIFNLYTSELIANLKKNNEYILIAKGGLRGLGNHVFKSSTNRSPKLYTNGNKGEYRKLKLELELNSDIGILGLVNSGKSSLINILTNSNSKIDFYPFTTKNPKLGILVNKNYEKFSIIDTPAIIKGSYLGKAFGLNFLKHLKKCNLLLYVIDSSFINNEISLLNNINIIYNEIISYNSIFNNKKIWIILNKTDLINNIYKLKKKIKNNLIFSKYRFYYISCINKININILLKDLYLFLNNKYNMKYDFNDELKINWNYNSN